MKIERLKVKNFRNIKKVDITFNDFTVIIGQNGAGKTTLIESIDKFFNKTAKMTDSDFYRFKTRNPIEIEILFSRENFPDELLKLTGGYKIKRVFKYNESPSYVTELGSNMFKDLSEFIKLIIMRSDESQYKNAEDKQGTALNDLASMVLSEIKGSLDDKINEYAKKIRKQVNTEELSNDVKVEFESIAKNIDVKIDWVPTEFKLKNRITVKQDDVYVDIVDSGSGTQRLVMYGLLNYHAKQGDRKNRISAKTRTHLLIVDGPEIHQHEIRNKSFYNTLKKISEYTQVVCATHSRSFVTIENIFNIRMLKKTPKLTKVFSCEKKDESTFKVPFRYSEIRAALFSSAVVITEGPTDEMVINVIDKDNKLAREGISVINTGTVNNIPNTIKLFNRFEIPCFVVWDLDNNCNLDSKNHIYKRNIMIYKLQQKNSRIYKRITSSYTCFNESLGSYLDDLLDKHPRLKFRSNRDDDKFRVLHDDGEDFAFIKQIINSASNIVPKILHDKKSS
ncbi:MAG: AAA family ATPase [Hyphomicrobiaceae bacterium]|nr:AAA family ATPase [Hyphomicrobiaceae bacterium]